MQSLPPEPGGRRPILTPCGVAFAGYLLWFWSGWWGMKGVDTIARIRREFFVRGRAIKEIVRELHVSRNTVRKVLRSGATEFTYQREVQPLPKLGRWKAELDRLLAANEAKPARERLTLIRVFEALRALGYEGGYDAVRRYARTRRRETKTSTDAYIPLTFAPGEAYQFDWSHEVVLINGTTVIVKVAPLRLCPSRPAAPGCGGRRPGRGLGPWKGS